MAQVYQSRITGEQGIYDDAGRFSWASADEIQGCLSATGPYYCEDGEPMADDDPLWDDLFLVGQGRPNAD